MVLTTHYLEEAEALADRVCVVAAGKVVSQGTVDALRAQVALRKIRCVTSVSETVISSWEGVASIEIHHGRKVIATADAEGVVKTARCRLRAFELEVQRAGLAEAFQEITRSTDTAKEAA